MPSATQYQTPSLSTFLKSLKTTSDIETNIEALIQRLKARQIRNSRPCALATAQLLLRVVAARRIEDPQKLITRIRDVGRRLVAAQPRELAIGNIVRRVIGVVREVAEQQRSGKDGSDDVSGATTPVPGQAKRPSLPTNFSSMNPLSQAVSIPQDLAPRSRTPIIGDVSPPMSSSMDLSEAKDAARRPILPSSTSYAGTAPQVSSLLDLLQEPLGRSPAGTPPIGTQSPVNRTSGKAKEIVEKIDLKAEIIDGIKELLEEIEIVDDQIAENALDHIHSNEIILTHTSSQTVQAFLRAAAKKRKFTVIHAEAYPNDYEATHATILSGGKRGVTGGSGDDPDADERFRPLTSMGITVILVPDTAVFALMSRINKVILAPHTVLANGSFVAAAGASTICLAAKAHTVPVVVLSGIYKLSPVYPFDRHELIEYGDPGKIVSWHDGEFMDRVDVVNPLYEWVESDCVELYVTNLGGEAPSGLQRLVKEHYWSEDVELGR